MYVVDSRVKVICTVYQLNFFKIVVNLCGKMKVICMFQKVDPDPVRSIYFYFLLVPDVY